MHLPLLAAVLLAAPTSAALINLIPVQVSKRMCSEGAPNTRRERDESVCGRLSLRRALFTILGGWDSTPS
jgi:hypothetical protein